MAIHCVVFSWLSFGLVAMFYQRFGLWFRCIFCCFRGTGGFWKICWKNFKDRVHTITVDAGEETGILALTLIANRNLHGSERYLWLLLLFASLYGAYFLSSNQIKRYFESPTVIAVDRNYRGWSGNMPAVTICYYEHIDTFKANQFIEDNWNVSFVDDDYFYFMSFLYAVLNATTSNYADLTRFADDERFDSIDLYDLIKAVDSPFEHVFTSFDADAEIEVMQVMTENGLCYAINSPMSAVLTGRDVDFKEFKPPITCKYGKQQCFIRMDLYSTGTIDVHGAYEVSVTGASLLPLKKLDAIFASYKVMETVAPKNIRELTVKQRKCVFNDEESSHLKIYSKSLCLMRCRAMMALEMCNCMPFFYQFLEGPSCTPAGFECLFDYKWPVWALHICKCPSTCNEAEYTLQTVKRSSWGRTNSDDDGKSDVISASFQWDLIPPKVRMRRDVVFTFEDLLVSFGGTLSLLLGFSIVSVTQLGYVLTYHLLDICSSWVLQLSKYFSTLWKPRRITTYKRNKVPQYVSNNLWYFKRNNLLALHEKFSKDSNITTEDFIEDYGQNNGDYGTEVPRESDVTL